jgi:hypothetical protein
VTSPLTLSPRDRRALSWLGVSALLSLVVYFWPDSAGAPTVVATNSDPSAVAARLGKLRATAATVPAKNDVLNKVSGDLALREKGLLKADTVPQAQAQLMQIIRRTMQAERPPLEIRSTELNGIKPVGDGNYGEVSVAIQMDCKIDQLVNFLASLPAQPELIATSDLRIISSNAREKTVNVRVTISGVVAQKLIPQKLMPQKPQPAGQKSKPAGTA